ncbi:glycerate dehydrogenase [Leuconostoc litchii]|uniref:D-2-hydroxyacid dehydrogenase n=1 Tax=Leuconostoc litchii TaxID=1981069 RepID=A0A6P2CNS8_9LACO|nr:D-2-hydroxyacid dehydrogenase [Leuconostoc litchii]TYC47033.1 D-2-hydroxyacid dehydrogenase [Leuconostoc litchii]GMA68957.1 glycerate dehydrogenase [Leuconostoc litchii]
MVKIVLLDGYDLNNDLNWETLRSLGDCVFYDRTKTSDDNEIISRIDNAAIVITHKTPINKYVISQSPNLKYIGIMGTGYDVVDIDSTRKKNIVVTNIPTYASDAVAQFTFSLLLEVTGQVGLHNQLVHQNRWSQGPDFTFWEKPLFELKGKTLGIIGFGHIAQKVAKLAHAFEMNVVFYNHLPKEVQENWLKQVSLDELLKISDVVSLHIIQTPQTLNLINKTTLAKMKRNAILLNTSRGKLINENDVAEALNNHKLYALATDVVSKEPIRETNPLLKAINCYITPHIAWAPLETRERLLSVTVSNIRAYLSGSIVNQIN